MWIVLYALIILSSTLVLPVSESYWMPKNAIFITLGMIVIASSWLSRKSRTTFYNPWLSLCFIYFAIMFSWVFLKPLVFDNARGLIIYNMWTIISSLDVLIGLLLIYTLVEYTDTLDRWINIAKVICWLGLGLSIYGILQYFDLDQIFWHTKKLHENRVCLFLGNPMLAGHFLAIISPLALIFRKFKYNIIYAIIGVTVFLTESSSSAAVFIIGLMMFLLFTGKLKVFITLIITGFILGILVFKLRPGYYDISGRLDLWKEVLLVCKEKAITGWGLGWFFTRKFTVAGHDCWAHVPHNTFLLIIHESGIIGLGLVLCYLASLFRRLLIQMITNTSMCLIGFTVAFINYLLVCQVGFPLSIAPLALVGILYIACLEVHCSIAR